MTKMSQPKIKAKHHYIFPIDKHKYTCTVHETLHYHNIYVISVIMVTSDVAIYGNIIETLLFAIENAEK